MWKTLFLGSGRVRGSVVLQEFWVDFHVHTVLSPCAELEMGAPEIVEKASSIGLDMIAISDHNNADNVEALIEASKGTLLHVIPGIEVQTEEDIHVLCLFPRVEETKRFQRWLWRRMPPRKNDPEAFGDQVVIDANNQILRFEETLLVQGVGYAVEEVIDSAHKHEGLAVLAHIDRPFFSYEAVLGPIPDSLEADALELSSHLTPEEAERWKRKYPRRVFIRSSDAHRLSDLSLRKATKMRMASCDFSEILKAFKQKEERMVFWPFVKGIDRNIPAG